MTAIRDAYRAHGVRAYYEQHGARYRNPHEASVARALTAAVRAWGLDLRQVLDLACGSGEVTLTLQSLGAGSVLGVDPYTGSAYQARTGQAAAPHSFEAIAAGALAGSEYSLIVCSYALHLLQPSRLPRLAFTLAQLAPALLILTPHKRPYLRPEWGWTLAGEMVLERVRLRHYESRLK